MYIEYIDSLEWEMFGDRQLKVSKKFMSAYQYGQDKYIEYNDISSIWIFLKLVCLNISFKVHGHQTNKNQFVLQPITHNNQEYWRVSQEVTDSFKGILPCQGKIWYIVKPGSLIINVQNGLKGLEL